MKCVLVTHVTLMMDGDPPSISLVFRRPVQSPSWFSTKLISGSLSPTIIESRYVLHCCIRFPEIWNTPPGDMSVMYAKTAESERRLVLGFGGGGVFGGIHGCGPHPQAELAQRGNFLP